MLTAPFELLLWFLASLLGMAQESQETKEPRSFSGIYPHLASFNGSNECGTGAVVPWAGRLWWITYAPHAPKGSDDKLYSIDGSLQLRIHPESVGGTPASRMIHRESGQLFLGAHAIDREGKVRTISPKDMPGRITGAARHLFDGGKKIYLATMEEGFYEVDVKTLEVTELFPDANGKKNPGGDLLPGYHGKGLYSGQGRLVYANNGERGREAQQRPDIESGALAEWDGRGSWRVIERHQFTEVSGPGGLSGNADPAKDPIWSIGWDHLSLILAVRDEGRWSRYRLPKGSFAYDGAHGWNTEWPRIREIGANGDDQSLLMTMHGIFWRFPRDFRPGNSAGLAPRSAYLKVVGDFCRWNDQLVFGTDDAAKSEFLNRRKAKGEIAGPAQSQSNLWFVEPEELDRLGPALGRGGVWWNDDVKAEVPSDPYMFDGYFYRGMYLTNHSNHAVKIREEIDISGRGRWVPYPRHDGQTVLPPEGSVWVGFESLDQGAWIRLKSSVDARLSAWFSARQADQRDTSPDERFDALARASHPGAIRGGLLRAGTREHGLEMLATKLEGESSEEVGAYRLTPDLRLLPDATQGVAERLRNTLAIPAGVLRRGEASIVYVDDEGRRFHLPLANANLEPKPFPQRIAREVTTERDLFQAGGTFYELPARNAGGFPKIRPIATHPYFVQDFASWRGLLVLSGIDADAKSDKHVIVSEDGHAAVWLGAVDDLWTLGKPRGVGGPWWNDAVHEDALSDPYLMCGFDEKTLKVVHHADQSWSFDIELDPSGTGTWLRYQTFVAAPHRAFEHVFPRGLESCWVRIRSHGEAVVSTLFSYS